MKNITKLALLSAALSSNVALANFFVGGSVGMNNTQMRYNITEVAGTDIEYNNLSQGSLGLNLEAGYRLVLTDLIHMTAEAFVDSNSYNFRQGSTTEGLFFKQSQTYSFGAKTRILYEMGDMKPYFVAGVGMMNVRAAISNGMDDAKVNKLLLAVKLGLGVEKNIAKHLATFIELDYNFAVDSAKIKNPGFDATYNPTVYGLKIGARYYFY